jgi:hypothetical protein
MGTKLPGASCVCSGKGGFADAAAGLLSVVVSPRVGVLPMLPRRIDLLLTLVDHVRVGPSQLLVRGTQGGIGVIGHCVLHRM